MAITAAPSSVLNTYSGLADLKARMGISGTDSDGELWMVLDAVSRAVDEHCNRRFYVLEATRRFDVADPSGFNVPDLISVTTLLEDLDGDRVYELTRSTGDYLLYPLNAAPESAWGRPFSRIVADPAGSRPTFSLGRSRAQVTGYWGYRYDLRDTGAVLAIGGTLTAEAVTVPVSDGSLIASGETALVESEHMFVRYVSGNDLTVVRGVNGTQAVSHEDALAVSVFRFPSGVVEAVLMLAARAWKRKDSVYGPIAGASGLGAVRVRPGEDPDIVQILSPLRKLAVGVGV